MLRMSLFLLGGCLVVVFPASGGAQDGPKGKPAGVRIVADGTYRAENGVSWLAVNDKGTELIVCTDLRDTTILDAKSLKVLKSLPQAGDRAEFAKDEKLLVVAPDSWKKGVQLIRRDGEVVKKFDVAGTFRYHRGLDALCHNGRKDEVFVRGVAEDKEIGKANGGHPPSLVRIRAFTKEGTLGLDPFDGKQALVWRAPFDKPPASVPVSEHFRGLALSADERHLAVGLHKSNTVEVRDVKTGMKVATLTGHAGKDDGVIPAYSADGAYLVTLSGKNEEGVEVAVWDARTYALLGKARTGDDRLTFNLVVYPDGQRFATGGNDAIVRLWRIEKDKQ